MGKTNSQQTKPNPISACSDIQVSVINWDYSIVVKYSAVVTIRIAHYVAKRVGFTIVGMMGMPDAQAPQVSVLRRNVTKCDISNEVVPVLKSHSL